MVLRFLMRYLVNNERLIQALADSYPIRKLARITARFILRAKYYKEDAIENLKKDRSFKDLQSESLQAKERMRGFSEYLKQHLQRILQEIQEQKRRR